MFFLRKRASFSQRWCDRLIYFFGMIWPIMTLPQIQKIWYETNIDGVSILTWSTYFIISCVWLIYGMFHKIVPIIFTNFLWILANGMIVIGILVHA